MLPRPQTVQRIETIRGPLTLLERNLRLVTIGAIITLNVEVCLQDEKPVRIGIQYSDEQHQIC